jgi:two-component system alkaline phosphatase synthesis response regulator PhoP
MMTVEGNPSDSVGLRVLVVDDDADVRLLCRLNLMKEGHLVLEAASGVDALELMHDARPDVVVLDLMMPRVDGLQVLRELREDVRTQSLPIVILSARTQTGDQIAGWTAGADAYVTKPFSPAGLSRAIVRTLGEINVLSPEGRAKRRETQLRSLEAVWGSHDVPGMAG